MKMSADILQDIKDSGDIELEMSAFTEEALNELLAKSQEGEVKEDDADLTPPENPVSEQGDIWLLGKHRLICGDSTKSETYENLMNGKKANLVVTDPPYKQKKKKFFVNPPRRIMLHTRAQQVLFKMTAWRTESFMNFCFQLLSVCMMFVRMVQVFMFFMLIRKV